MRQVLGWLLMGILCCAAGGETADKALDARLIDARTAFLEAQKLGDLGEYAKAIEQAERSLSCRETVLGGSHPDVARSLNLLGDLSRQHGDLVHAESFLERSLALREAMPEQPLDLATSLNNLAAVFGSQGLLDKAEPLLRRALALREAALGEHHPDVAGSLNNLAYLYFLKGQYGQAVPLYQRALVIQESALGPKSLDVALTLENLATVLCVQGLLDKAEPIFLRVLVIRREALGENHPGVAASLGNLANVCFLRGLYGRAETLDQRVLVILEGALGKNHPQVAVVLNDLANIDRLQGLYGPSESSYQRALAIFESALGPKHPQVAMVLNNLADLYMSQGLYGQAEPKYQQALAIREAALGPDHPDVADSLNDLALLYAKRGLYAQAQAAYQRSIAIREAAVGPQHPDLTDTLNNLANLYRLQGLYARAEPLYQRGLAIATAALGPNHLRVADSLLSLAQLSADQGAYSQAETLYRRSLAIREAAVGPDHPDVAASLFDLAQLELGQRPLADVLPLYTRAFASSERRLRQEALDFSEARLADFLQYLRGSEQKLYSLLRAHPEDARVRRLALSAVLLLKGRSFEETANISRTLYRSLGAEDRDAFERLQGLRTQLATLSLEGPGAPASKDYPRRLKELVDAGDALEADLARRSSALRARTALPPPEQIVQRVAVSLPKDGALLEFVAYGGPARRPGLPATPSASPEELRYLALVLLPDASTRAVDLGPAGPIDLAAVRLRDALANRDASFQAPARELYQLAFQPLLPLLGTTRRLLLSPEGPLGLVPFAALHDGHGFLLDSFDFTYLTSGREVLPRPGDLLPARSVVVLADPDFTARPPAATPPAPVTPSPEASRSAALERFFTTSHPELARGTWGPLPGTRREAESIQRLLPQAQLFLGPEATKQRLLTLATPGILHLATHGFFLTEVPAEDPPGTRAVGSFGALGEPSGSRLQDPLLRSGLALAGARASAAATVPPASDQASLVTALELSGLDLWGTQLVVLSACDTGRGEVHLGQGVYGLRRALMVAGAESLVMSLWQVKDDSTQLLMERYYHHLLAGQGRAGALREAMRELRLSRPHPHDWASFIVLGSDAPLRGITPASSRTSGR